MHVRLWGVRGSLATPLTTNAVRAKARALLAEATPADISSEAAIDRYLSKSPHSWTYGGNTSCVEISFEDQVFILDAGTGIRGLGQALKDQGKDRSAGLNLFFTHFHWDHICGLPFFPPLYMPDRVIDIWSGRKDSQQLLAAQMGSAHFPVKWPTLKSQITCRQLPEKKTTMISGAEVRIMPLIHPDKAFGYRITFRGRSVCYLTDTEVSKNPYRLAEIYSSFVSGADVVIVDAMYGFLEYHDKVNFGHSTIYNFIDFFKETAIGELVIFHHDPMATDANVTQLWREAIRYKAVIAPNATWKLSAAFEGQEWDLPDQKPAKSAKTRPARAASGRKRPAKRPS